MGNLSKKILLLLVFLALSFYLWKNDFFVKKDKLTQEEKIEEVKVLPIIIENNSTPETEAKAQEFSLLKSKCPINESTFSISFSYKKDKFNVLVAKDKEDEFWLWLATNYPKLDKNSFVITITEQ